MKHLKNFKDLILYQEELKEKYDPKKTRIRICMTGCRAHGAEKVRDAFLEKIKEKKLSEKVEVIETGCIGLCARAPLVVIDPQDIFYSRLRASDVPEIVEKTLLRGEVVERFLYPDRTTKKRILRSKEIPFFKEQTKIVLRNCGQIDPKNIDHYLQRDGYSALAKVLSAMSPETVIAEVKKSGLRGRGGAGFPTGLKWELCRNSIAPSLHRSIAYLICNGDEGDPGAFMDRALLEGDPHSVIEGMLIAGYAIGAEEGYIYVRAEYPLAVEHLKIALRQAEELGLLGKNILGSTFNFNLKIKEGAGAFVCGEETALIASIEGKRGMPRPRPPYPTEAGLWGRPTVINNVETLANLFNIILKGANWFKKTGTANSPGTKIFALAGKIQHTGLIEVPLGISLNKIIFDLGGGTSREKKFKAVQLGGPSGACLPEKYLDLPIDYDSLQQAGAIMGSGGMIVLNSDNCMVDIARYFLEFTRDESCGKCTPCRIGTKRMHEILNHLVQGKGTSEDLNLLEELGKRVQETSLCGLGQGAPNPVLSTLKYFREEYEAHLQKQCLLCGLETPEISPLNTSPNNNNKKKNLNIFLKKR